MQETARNDIPPTLTRAFYNEQQILRNKLLLFRFRNYSDINSEDDDTLVLDGIEPRLRQISACFTSLFAGQPDVLSDYRVFIGHHQKELVEQRAATTIGQVVERLFFLMESVTLVTNVTDVTGSKFIPISSGEIAQPLNMSPQAAGQILKTLGLRTQVVKVDGKPKRCIIFDKAKLDTLKKRYIPSEDEETVTMVTPVTSVTGLNEEDSLSPPDPCPKCGGQWAFDPKGTTSVLNVVSLRCKAIMIKATAVRLKGQRKASTRSVDLQSGVLPNTHPLEAKRLPGGEL